MSTDDTRGAGFLAAHDVDPDAPLHVAPSVGQELNTIRIPLVPIACWRMDDPRFDFDSSFVRPEARRELSDLAAQMAARPNSPATVFGHADPVGNDAYNKTLSGRRATAVYAVLVRDTALWEDLATHPFGGDQWTIRVTQRILGALARPSAPDEVYLPDHVTGHNDGLTQSIVREFQEDNGLTADGVVGPQTRRALFERYMDFLCVGPDGLPFRRAPADFLGRGADPGGKAARQGCGELNPVLRVSQADEQRFAQPATKPERDAKNAPNRRVMVYLFRPGTRVEPASWPCPRVDEDAAACKAQQWPDGDVRRGAQAEERQYAHTRDTMACRFYEMFARRSPCEGIATRFTAIEVRLFDGLRRPMRLAPYRLKIGTQVRQGVTNNEGFVIARAIEIPNEVVIEWGLDPKRKGPDDGPAFDFSKTIHLDFDQGDDDAQADRRLHNLGYPRSRDRETNVRAFQRDHDLDETGELDPRTRDELTRVHDELSPRVATT